MKRIPLLVLALGLLLVPSAGAAKRRAAQPQLHYAAKLVKCHSGVDPVQRFVEAKASLKSYTGAKRLGVRFDLLTRAPGSTDFTPLAVPALGVWKLSDPRVGTFNVSQRVDNLAQTPAAYRFRVGFRWYGAKGRVLKQRSELTKVCVQPDMRPNLVVTRFFAEAIDGKPRKNRYTVVVRNAGRTPTGPFSVALTFPGQQSTIQTFAQGVGAGQTARRVFVGSLCANGSPSVVLDSTNQVAEKDEADNTSTAICPPA